MRNSIGLVVFIEILSYWQKKPNNFIYTIYKNFNFWRKKLNLTYSFKVIISDFFSESSVKFPSMYGHA